VVWANVSIIWLNHNSSRIIPIVLESLESIADLDYPSDRYELIVVDNGSTDGSFERIKGFLEKKTGLRKKVIRLHRNLGFTGGNNVGFAARDRESGYVLLLNNDAILFQGGLRTLVEYAENNGSVAGLQGVVLKYRSRLIDTAGGYVNELLQTYPLGVLHEYPWILRKPIYVTYVDGSCAFYRVRSVVRCLDNRLFIDEFFGYGDDPALGLMMWNCGYKLVAIPEAVASHVRGLTFGRRSILSDYLSGRNRVALSLITNTRYKSIILLHVLRSITTSMLKTGFKGSAPLRARTLPDGIRLGKRLRSKGLFINIYRAPLIKIPIKDLIVFFTARRLVAKYFENWALRNLNSLTTD